MSQLKNNNLIVRKIIGILIGVEFIKLCGVRCNEKN